MIKKKVIILFLFVLSFGSSLGVIANLTEKSLKPTSNTIVIGMDFEIGNGYNITEIDVPKNTNYTIIFVNSQKYIHDLIILKPGIVVNELNSTNITSNFYDLKLGPITNTTVKGTWLSPNFNTWIIYYDDLSSADFTGSASLLKVGSPNQSPPFVLNTEPGFDTSGVILSIVVLFFCKFYKKLRS